MSNVVLKGVRKTSPYLAMSSNGVLAVGRIKNRKEVNCTDIPIVYEDHSELLLPNWLEEYNQGVYRRSTQQQ